MKQADYFLEGEGDEWFRRNLSKSAFEESLRFVEKVVVHSAGSVLGQLCLPICEVGSSRGDRIFRISGELGLPGIAVDPSTRALESGREVFGDSLTYLQGTSNRLDFESQSLGMVFFSFCLYLNSENEFQQSIGEARRVLADGGVLAIFDFDSQEENHVPYRHLESVFSYRRDYLSQILAGNFGLIAKIPLTHESGYEEMGFDFEVNERTAVWVFRKL